jgi:hypothetical protein
MEGRKMGMTDEEKRDARGNGDETPSLEEFSKSFRGYFSRVQDLLQCARLDDVLARNDDDMLVIGHGNMLAFSKNVKPRTPEGSHDAFMRDLWKLGHTVTSTVRSFFNRFRSSTLSR